MQAEKESTVHKIVSHLKDLIAHLNRMKTIREELELDSQGEKDPFFPLVQGTVLKSKLQRAFMLIKDKQNSDVWLNLYCRNADCNSSTVW